ncbi:probable F420-dependent oxidoreductase, MSMEG_4141 family [Amycolatopsis xylanica]|uniref:Probable F420-dependent oxidoreductase, MSMEG_4141 family n=1 Tax=Amycolatopsis xylanica TaxID=589385 RepID=A0A1H3CYB8_9PSEU|nr:TIGR03620 family F420-dependent LLM class oxidoreductase [Amycolatopsis xylanica]SDX58544.1 probable F420-dependent oxidoreductase, MSMEG_4141 family [Amycolatopsis xylanica]
MIEETRARLGPVGVWLPSAPLGPPLEAERRANQRIEELGYGSAWSGEGVAARDLFDVTEDLLGATSRLTIGTGIANIWARDARTAQARASALAAAHPGRFVLGVGIGHAFQTESAYQPLAQTRAYLSTMDYSASPLVLAAVGPRMLELAGELTDGAHPFAQPFEHTPYAREILGPDKLLIPHQAVLLGTRDEARAALTRTVEQMTKFEIPHYMNSWKRLGFTDLSDRLVDSLYAWGDEESIAGRVRLLLDSGADHVLVSPVGATLESIVDQLARLAPALKEITR